MAQAGAVYRGGSPARTSGGARPKNAVRRGMRPGEAAEKARRMREARMNRVMLRVTIGVVVVSLFVYITQMAGISANAKEIGRIRKEITQLKEERQYLEVKLAARQDLERVRDEAIGRLGMGYPDEGEVRIISLSGYASNLNTQTVHDNTAP